MTKGEAEALVGKRVYHRAAGINRRKSRRRVGRWGVIETCTPHIEAPIRDPGAAHFTFAIAYDNDVDGETDALVDELDLGCDVAIEPGPEEVTALEVKWGSERSQDRIRHAQKRT